MHLNLKMRVKFFTEGGTNIGIGHITRCLSLCQAFEEYEINCHFVIKGDEELKDILADRKTNFLDWIEDSKAFEKEIQDAQIVIIDSYLADIKNYEIVCQSKKKALFIDDYNRLDYPCGYILNGSIGIDEKHYSKKEGLIYLLGTKYIPLRKPFWDVEKKEIRKNIKKILITFGGDDSENMTLKILKLLQREYYEFEKLVVVSSLFREKKEIYKLASDKIKIFENLDAEGMKNLMLTADIAISAGGQTTYELARVGVPSILIAVSDNQVGNCHGWEKANFAKYAGWWSDTKTQENLIYYLKELEDFEIRRKMSSTGRSLVDGQGARRVVRKILEA